MCEIQLYESFQSIQISFCRNSSFFFLFTCFEFTYQLIKLCNYNNNAPGIDEYGNRHILGRLIFGKLCDKKVGAEDSMKVCK